MEDHAETDERPPGSGGVPVQKDRAQGAPILARAKEVLGVGAIVVALTGGGVGLFVYGYNVGLGQGEKYVNVQVESARMQERLALTDATQELKGKIQEQKQIIDAQNLSLKLLYRSVAGYNGPASNGPNPINLEDKIRWKLEEYEGAQMATVSTSDGKYTLARHVLSGYKRDTLRFFVPAALELPAYIFSYWRAEDTNWWVAVDKLCPATAAPEKC